MSHLGAGIVGSVSEPGRPFLLQRFARGVRVGLVGADVEDDNASFSLGSTWVDGDSVADYSGRMLVKGFGLGLVFEG